MSNPNRIPGSLRNAARRPAVRRRTEAGPGRIAPGHRARYGAGTERTTVTVLPE